MDQHIHVSHTYMHACTCISLHTIAFSSVSRGFLKGQFYINNGNSPHQETNELRKYLKNHRGYVHFI